MARTLPHDAELAELRERVAENEARVRFMVDAMRGVLDLEPPVPCGPPSLEVIAGGRAGSRTRLRSRAHLRVVR